METIHYSDCAVHNEPAYPAGECDCGAAKISKGGWLYPYHLFCFRSSPLRRFLMAKFKILFALPPYHIYYYKQR